MRSGTRQLNVQDTHKTQGIQVISRAADILRVLGENAGGQSLGQIARKVELPRSTVQRIVSALSETVDLAVLEGPHMRFIDQIEGSQRLRTVSTIGDKFPLTTTANGKAALAQLSDASARTLIAKELGSDRDVATLMAELHSIRESGIASDLGEHSEEVCALGFAVVGPNKEIAAISVPVPSSRFHRIKADLGEKLHKIRRNAFFSD